MTEAPSGMRLITEILDIRLEGDTVHFTAQLGLAKVTSNVECGESLLFGKLIRAIHDNQGFNKGLRIAYNSDDVNRLRLALNEALKEI